MRIRTLFGFVGSVVALLSFAPEAAWAQTGAPAADAGGAQVAPVTDFAVIDTRRVVAESEIGRGIAERAEAAARDWDSRIAAGRQELTTLAQRREEQALTLSASALAALSAEIDEKGVALQRLEEDARRQLTLLNEELMVELNATLGPTLQSFAQERGFQFVFDSARAAETGLLYWAPEVDVTGDFISAINGATAEWREVRSEDGVPLGRARVSESDWLQESVFAQALRRVRR